MKVLINSALSPTTEGRERSWRQPDCIISNKPTHYADILYILWLFREIEKNKTKTKQNGPTNIHRTHTPLGYMCNDDVAKFCQLLGTNLYFDNANINHCKLCT